jgi:hypothetical protein
MIIFRLSTLSLSLAIAVMTLGFANTAIAAKPVCPGPHPSCGDGGDPGREATLMG